MTDNELDTLIDVFMQALENGELDKVDKIYLAIFCEMWFR